MYNLNRWHCFKRFMHKKFPNKIATKNLAQISRWQLEYLQNWSILALQIFFSSIVLIKTITGKNPRTYLCLPSEIIFFTTFPIIKPLFCAKIFCPIIDPQNTTVPWNTLPVENLIICYDSSKVDFDLRDEILGIFAWVNKQSCFLRDDNTAIELRLRTVTKKTLWQGKIYL